jgi:hypothetical protein
VIGTSTDLPSIVAFDVLEHRARRQLPRRRLGVAVRLLERLELDAVADLGGLAEDLGVGFALLGHGFLCVTP